MKKKTDLIDKAEIVENPSSKYQEIKQINEEMLKINEIEANLQSRFDVLSQQLNNEVSHDKEIFRKDTVTCIKRFLEKIIKEFNLFKDVNPVIREKLYYKIHGVSLLFYDYCHKMRKANYSIHATKYLIWIISVMDANVILSGIKYLDWRIKLYCELASCYEDYGAYQAALKVINQANSRLTELKLIEEQQVPLPEFIKGIITENQRILKIFEIKYSIYSNALPLEAWKKKVDDSYPDDRFYKIMCIINSVSNLSKNNSIISHDGLKISWKISATIYAYELVKGDINDIKRGILEFIEKKKRNKEKSNKINENQTNYQTIIQQFKEIDDKVIKKSTWKNAIRNVPIEVHMELLKSCYDCKLWKEFLDLIESLLVRIKYRRIEEPYICDIDIQVSPIQYANIPNKYERIQVDLNINNFKKEIRRLTEQGKYVPGGKRPDSKQDLKAKPGQKAVPPKKGEIKEEKPENPYEEIEGLEHEFIYLLLKRTHNPKKAIIEVNFQLGNIKLESKLGQGERAVAIPIKLYDPTAEKKNLIPFIIFKKTLNGLKNEEDQLSAITDIKPLISNSPYTSAPNFYTKNEFELTNYCLGSNYNFNHNYIYFCIKKDEIFQIIERKTNILKSLYELELTYIEKTSTDYNNIKKIDKFLNLNFDIEKIEIVSNFLNGGTQGPIGKTILNVGIYFLKERRNFFYEICTLIWNKYLKDLLSRVDYFYDIEKELEEVERNAISDRLNFIRKFLFSTISNIHSVLTKIENKDVIIYSLVASRLADLSESSENFSIGVNALKSTIEYINSYKEKIFKFGVDSEMTYHSFTTFTCDNNKIKSLYDSVNGKFEDYEKKLNFKRRKQFRNFHGLNKLSNDEEFEENFESILLEKEYEEKYKKSNNSNNSNEKPNKFMFLKENDNILNCLCVDLIAKYYRLYIKNEFVNKYNTMNKSNLENSIINKTNSSLNSKTKKSKISELKTKKLDIIKGQTATQVKKNMDFLKQSLQEAGKMDPDKPIFEKYEKEILLEIGKNTYLNVIFKIMMANFRTGKQDQKYLFLEALEIFKKLINEENDRYRYFEQHFFFIIAAENINMNKSFSPSTFYPYNLLYKDIMIENYEKIPEPILIHKTQSTATFIFPKVKIRKNNLDEFYYPINRVSLFGQISSGTNIVALHNNKLTGTGKIISVFDYQSVSHLKYNEKYIYAYGGYDNENIILGQIGNTSKEVEAYFPLPLFYIAYYIGKMTYEYGHYEICKEISKIVFNNFTEKSDIKDTIYDNKSLSIFFYKLKYNYISRTCYLELEGVAYSFYFFARSIFLMKTGDHIDKNGINISLKQKNILKNLNILMLGLEISSYIRHFNLIKLFTEEIYSVSDQLIKQKNRIPNLHNLFIRCSVAINLIPSENWDVKIRTISSLIDYQILILLINNNEVEIYKKLLAQEIGLPKRKFINFNYNYLKKQEDPKAKKVNEKDKKVQQSQPEEEKFIETPGYLIKELERESAELDEFIISQYDYNDVMRTKVNQITARLDNKYSGMPEFSAELEKRKKEILDIIDIWEGFKTEGVPFLKKYAVTYRDSEKYYEICAGLVKRSIEIAKINNISDIVRTMDDIIIKESDITYVSEIYKQKISFLSADIVYSMKLRIIAFLDKIEKNDIKTQTSSVQDINLDKIRAKIEEKYFGASIENEKIVPFNKLLLNEIYLLKEKYFWIGDILHQKAIVLFYEYIMAHPTYLNYDFNNFLNYKLVDLQKLKKMNTEDKAFVDCRLQEDRFKDLRTKQLSKIFDKIANATLFLNEISSYSSIDNIVIFCYNILTYEMMCPNDSMKENIWSSLSIISEIAIKRLEYLKSGKEDFKQLDYEKELKKLKDRLGNTSGIKTQSNFTVPKKYVEEERTSELDEETLIEQYKLKINLDTYIQLITFTIQCVHTAEKWNILADIIQKFNDVTRDNFGDFTLGFLIEAQTKLFDKAALNTNNKKNECQQSVAAFETWKNSKKKNKRQQMITGEIPPEQIEFEREYNILCKELYILESIENLLKSDKDMSEKKLSALINDSNNCAKTLNSCRKLFEKYQMETFTLNLDINSKGSEHFDVKSKKKAIKLFANSIVTNYKKAIQILKKRQENYLLIQALYEMSLILYSDDDLKSAEIYLNEALDTVFQKLYSLREYRSLFESTKNIAEKFQIKPLFYSILILHKLLKYCYDTDLYKQRECCLMGAEIIYQILIPYLPNPQNVLNFSTYRMSEIHKNINVFDYSENIKPSLLLEAGVDICEILISYADFDKCLPLLCLQEYIACDIVKSIPYLLKSRIQKIICLAELGLISEAMQIYYKIIKKLDLPNVIPFTTFNEKNIGKFASSSKDIKYFNNLPPDNQKNQEALSLFTRLNADSELKNYLGNNYHCELIYSKCLLLFRIFEKENYIIFLEKSDNRLEYFLRIQGDLKEILLNVAAGEELTNLISLLNFLKGYPEKKEQMEWTQRKIDDIVQSKKLTSEELNNLYLAKFNKNEIDLRIERLELIYKIRFLFSRLYSCQSLHLSSTSVLLKLIINIQSFSINKIIGVENGEDYIFDFKLTDQTQAKAKNVEKKPDPKDKKNQNVALNINLDEELNKLLQSGYNNQGKRSHPNPILWLKCQYMILLNYFKQNRMNDCKMIIDKNCLTSQSVNDSFYLMRFKEIEVYMNMHNFDLERIAVIEEEIKNIAKNYYINEYEHTLYLVNYSEFLFKIGKKEEAINKIKEARRMLWSKLGKMNYFINNQSFADKKFVSNLEIDKEIKQVLIDKEALVIVPVVGKKGAEPPKKKDEAKSEILPTNYNTIINYQDNTRNKDNLFDKINYDANNSDEGSNLYFKYTESLCRVDLKYCLYLLTLSNIDFTLIESVINDVETLFSKLLYPHNSISILINYIQGKLNKILFNNNYKKFIEEKLQTIINKNKVEVLKPEILQKLSNYYNERCINVWIPLLNKSKDYLEKSIKLMKNEFYTIESGINLYNIIIELADVCILLAENRPSQNPKFVDYNQIVNKINNINKKQQFYDKENDDLPYVGDELVDDVVKNEKLSWTSERVKQEKLKIKNYLKESCYLLENACKMLLYKKYINESTHDLALTNLIDPSKVPKDVFSQLLEYDYLNKKKNKSYFTNIQIKPSPETSDVLYLLRNLTKECEYLTFHNDENLKNLSKLHKYLRLNCTNYNSKAYFEVFPYTEFSDPLTEIIKKDQMLISWIDDNSQNYLIYIVGPNSSVVDFNNYNFARIPFNRDIAIELNRCFFDLRNVFKLTLTYSEQRKVRDLKYLQANYINYIMRFSAEFLKRKDLLTDIKKLETLIKKEYLGDISLENLDFWINMTLYPVFNISIQRFNALFNDLHQKLFA